MQSITLQDTKRPILKLAISYPFFRPVELGGPSMHSDQATTVVEVSDERSIPVETASIAINSLCPLSIGPFGGTRSFTQASCSYTGELESSDGGYVGKLKRYRLMSCKNIALAACSASSVAA